MSRSFPHPDLADIELAQVLSALSDRVRLAMVRSLADGAAVNGGDLAPHLAKSTVTHHARVLREAGITYTRPEGRVCWISLRRNLLNKKFPGLLDIVLLADRRREGTSVGLGILPALLGERSTLTWQTTCWRKSNFAIATRT